MKILAMLLLVLSFNTYSTENDKYLYCEIAGMAQANNAHFISSLAQHKYSKQGLGVDNVCNLVRKDSFDFVKNTINSSKKKTTSDVTRFMKYQKFEEKVQDKILEIID